MPQLFDSAMPAVMRHVAEPHPLVLNSALLAASALLSSLGVRLVPHMPVFMPPLLRRLEAALAPAEPPRDSLLVAAAWLDGCGVALLNTLPLFLHPYLSRLLRSLLRLAQLHTPSARAVGLNAKAQAVGRALAKAIPSRQLLPAMVDAIGHAAQAGAPALVELLQLVQTHVMMRPPTEARSHHVLVFQVH
jgi:U3 small nucleolar RNA-associated protein 10